MCATGFLQLIFVTELPITTCEGLVCRHLLGICPTIVTHQLTKKVTFCAEKVLLYLFIINEVLQHNEIRRLQEILYLQLFPGFFFSPVTC